MWASGALTVCAVVLLVNPKVRRNEKVLPFICAAVIVAIWIEKGMGLVVTGFIPSPLGKITEYLPTGPETMITAGVYGIGFLILTLFYKIVVNVREKTEQAG
jgi:molybdopterin-containing oxidoreductase family membrane subunit